MSNALSMDLRGRFRKLMDGGKCAAAAGRSLLLSRATAARWGKKVRDGEPLEPLRSGPRKGSGWLESFLMSDNQVGRQRQPGWPVAPGGGRA